MVLVWCVRRKCYAFFVIIALPRTPLRKKRVLMRRHNSRVSQSAFIFTPKHCISFVGGILVFSSIHAPFSELSGFSISLLDAKVRFSLLPSKPSCCPTTSFTFLKWEISHGLQASFHCVSKICAIMSSLLSSFKQTYLWIFTAFCVQKFFSLGLFTKGVQDLRSLQTKRVRPKCIISGSGGLSDASAFFANFFFRLVLNTCGFSAIWVYPKLLLKQPVFLLLWVVCCDEAFFNFATIPIALGLRSLVEHSEQVFYVVFFFWFVEARVKLPVICLIFCHF